MRTIVKNLKKYKWTYSNKSITVQDRTTGQLVVLDKVGFMSLARFILRSLDTMRIDEVKRLGLKLSNIKLSSRAKIKTIKDLTKTQKDFSLYPKKESRHSVGDPSKNSSGEQV